jgi:hypothetical protein
MKPRYTRAEVLDLLRLTVVTVNFTKADGTLRDMKCTLLGDHIPDDQKPKAVSNGELVKATNWPDDVIRVFDTEAGAWRSFRLDSVNSIEVL